MVATKSVYTFIVVSADWCCLYINIRIKVVVSLETIYCLLQVKYELYE